MSDLSEFFSKIADKLSVLNNDIQRISYNKVAPADKKKDMKSLQRVTHFRKDKEEAQYAKDNPDETFIIDTLKDIFKG